MLWILYLDVDAYYVSVELRDRPDLRDRPVIVGPPPSEGRTRGVVLSASYEARAYGVRSALPAGEAARLCPEAVWIPPDFPKYEQTAEELRKFLTERVGPVVAYSIDEVAARIEAPSAEEARACALALQAEVATELRLPCSIGVAPHRRVAKIASDRAKPGGVVVVAPEAIQSFLAPLPVRSIPGVGRKTEEQLGGVGVRRIGDLLTIPRSKLHPRLGSFADELIRLARGVLPEEPWVTSEAPRSRSAERTFDEDVLSLEALRSAAEELARRLAEGLARERLRYQTVTVALRWEDFQRVQRSRTLPAAQEGSLALVRNAERLLRELLETERSGRGRAVRTLSVRAERLLPSHARQVRLDAEDERGASQDS